jgi:hypothetical protein
MARIDAAHSTTHTNGSLRYKAAARQQDLPGSPGYPLANPRKSAPLEEVRGASPPAQETSCNSTGNDGPKEMKMGAHVCAVVRTNGPGSTKIQCTQRGRDALLDP